jgi:hypothetical protein
MKDLLMKLQLLLAGILLVLLAACSPPPNLRDPNYWHDDSLITNDPCAAPCWQNITPGETTWSEARSIISNLSGTIDLQFQEENGQAVAVWHPAAETDYCCAVVSIYTGETVAETDVVSFIQLRLAPDITLGELIEAQGEPTYLINGEAVSDDQAYIVLIYPEISIMVYAFVAGAENGALSASSEIWFVYYLTPDVIQNEVIAGNNLQEWEGYQSFSYYAEGEANPFEVTPRPTNDATVEATSDADASEDATSEATSENEATEEATPEADATEAP